MRLSIGQAAKLGGVSVRTLRHYDEIGLLKPVEISQAGYRYYDEAALLTLTQVRFYRELGIPLEKIFMILRHPNDDASQALRDHRALLELKRKRIDEQLRLLDSAIGGKPMQPIYLTLADIRHIKDTYAREAEARYGVFDVWKESQTHADGDEEMLRAAAEANDIFRAFAQIISLPPQGDEALFLAARWQAHITRYHYHCTPQILLYLANLYVDDARFAENIDRFGAGTARFMRDALKAYCKTLGI